MDMDFAAGGGVASAESDCATVTTAFGCGTSESSRASSRSCATGTTAVEDAGAGGADTERRALFGFNPDMNDDMTWYQGDLPQIPLVVP